MSAGQALAMVGALLTISTVAVSGQMSPSTNPSTALPSTFVQALSETYESQLRWHQPVVAEAAPRRQDAGHPRRPSMPAGALIASGGSLAGLFAGTFTGFMLTGGGDSLGEVFTSMAAGAAIGSWLGAAGGSIAVGGHMGRSIGGSAAGVLLGLVLVDSMDAGFGAELAVFTLSHGLTTAVLSF